MINGTEICFIGHEQDSIIYYSAHQNVGVNLYGTICMKREAGSEDKL